MLRFLLEHALPLGEKLSGFLTDSSRSAKTPVYEHEFEERGRTADEVLSTFMR